MRLYKLLLASAGACVLCCALASSAYAGRFSFSSSTMRASFREVTFRLPFGNTVCAMTVEGSMHSRTFAKSFGTLIGYATRNSLGACSSGSATVLAETFPWHYRYGGFTGTLPNFTAIFFPWISFSWRVREPFGITCLARSSEEEPASIRFNREAGGALTSAEVGGEVRVGAECFGARGTFTSDRGPITVAGAATRITLTLI
jgi:hypothetical protein